jgi:hypothetical protein
MIYIYLDTSFLSQLSKAASNTKQKVAGTDKWGVLLNVLRQGVYNASCICPASQFQTQEVMLAKGLQKAFLSLQYELCHGRYFREWQEILVHQTADELLRYLGRPQDIDPSWEPFTENPPNVVDDFTTNKMKSDMAKFAQLMQAPESLYAKEYDAQKASFLQNSFLQPIRQLLGLPTYSNSFDFELLAMLMREAQVKENELQKALQFFDSASVDSVPLIHIFCSIFASLRFHESNRNYTGNEREDTIALACVIPYCQIVTTDANMKTNVVDRLHFDKKYTMSVFVPRKDNLDALAHVLSESGGYHETMGT